MKVKDIMNKEILSIDSEDLVSHALGTMKKHRAYQLIVLKNGKYEGLLELKKIVTKDIDPDKTKISTLMSKAPVIDEEKSVEEAAKLILDSGFHAIPVMKDNKIEGVISDSDILPVALSDMGKKTKVSDIMSSCVYVSPEDKASTVKNIMIDANVSRVPVVKDNKVVGVIGTLEMIPVLEGKIGIEHRGVGKEKGAGERIKTEDIRAEALMSTPVVVSGDKKLADVIELVSKKELIVSDGDICVVTPKDVLELIIPESEKSVHVQITGMQNEPTEVVASIDRYVNDFIQKLGRSIEGIEFFFVHVESHHKGGRKKYSIRLRMRTPLGLFVAHRWGWEPVSVIQEVFDVLERNIRKKYEKVEESRKRQQEKKLR